MAKVAEAQIDSSPMLEASFQCLGAVIDSAHIEVWEDLELSLV